MWENHKINSVCDLTVALNHQWNAIPDDVIRRYNRSMPSKVFTLHYRRAGYYAHDCYKQLWSYGSQKKIHQE